MADRPVLDFLPTLASRGTVEEEKLRTGRNLADWAVQSGIVDVAPRFQPGDLDRAKALREVLFRMVAALIENRPASPEDRALANAAAAIAPPVPRLDDDGLHRVGDLDSVLAVLARDCLDLHVSADKTALRWCADQTCTRPFIDRSRGQLRRWCGMKGCGDRAKAAAYRRRQRATTEPRSARPVT